MTQMACNAPAARLLRWLAGSSAAPRAPEHSAAAHCAGGAGADNKQQLKFPFVACEVFCCEVDAVLDALLESARHLDHLFSLLAGSAPLNSVLVGYFARILTALLIKRPQVCLTGRVVPATTAWHGTCAAQPTA